MGGDILAIYRRAGLFARALPLLIALPIGLELVRQAMAASGRMPPYGPVGFTLASTAAMLVILVASVRFWRFGDDVRLRRTIGRRVLIGVVAFMVIQLTDEFLFTSAGRLAAHLTGERLFMPLSQLLWLFVSVPLYPWYVAMLSNDPLTLPQSFAAIRPRWPYGFALVFLSILPLLLIGLVLRASKLLDPGIGWLALTALGDGILIAVMTVVTDSAYFAVYRMVRPADPAASSSTD